MAMGRNAEAEEIVRKAAKVSKNVFLLWTTGVNFFYIAANSCAFPQILNDIFGLIKHSMSYKFGIF